MNEPHAYAVEVLVNSGSPRAYWEIDNGNPPREHLSLAEEDLDELIAIGYDPAHVRVIALSVVTA